MLRKRRVGYHFVDIDLGDIEMIMFLMVMDDDMMMMMMMMMIAELLLFSEVSFLHTVANGAALY